MNVKKFVNTIFTSNSYLLDFEWDKGIWVIDPGDSKPLIQWMIKNNKYLKGIIITHSHFDHIYGINDLYDLFPEIKIFASKEAKEGMLSAKLNSSYYTDYPFVVECPNICIVEENYQIKLSENIHARVIYTPGHNNDCLSFEIKHYLFTGDALIPGIKVYTKSKFGDKLLAKETIDRIVKEFNYSTMICPGHGGICSLQDFVNSGLYDFDLLKEELLNI